MNIFEKAFCAIQSRFLKDRDFFGTYADTYIERKKFKTENDVILIAAEDESFKFEPDLPDGIDHMAAKVLIARQAKIHASKMRKQRHVKVWYCYNNIFERWLFFSRMAKRIAAKQVIK